MLKYQRSHVHIGTGVIGFYLQSFFIIPFGSLHITSIGRNYAHPDVQNILSRFPYRVMPDEQNRVAVEINGRAVSLTQVASKILEHIKIKGQKLLHRPIYRAVMPDMPWIVPAVLYGVVLWVFALYVMAHLVAGNAPFLGWGNITWVALWGHVLFALVTATVTRIRQA